ncbi:MAG: diversity-generating retroelement protein Avd [Bacteroidia bacterium]|nr:diversity-generating retroelement protein Avd [Bacteroidia bacterium]
MNANQETLVLKAYDLIKFTIPTLNRIPRNQKFVFGDRLQNHLSDLMEMLIEAHYAPKEQKYPILLRINIQIEKIRYFFRLGHDLNFYSTGHLGLLAERLDEIGRRVGGWMKVVPNTPK